MALAAALAAAGMSSTELADAEEALERTSAAAEETNAPDLRRLRERLFRCGPPRAEGDRG